MSNDPADCSVVEVVGSVAAEENSLQDPGRELDAVLQGGVERVHHRGPAVSDLGQEIKTHQQKVSECALSPSVSWSDLVNKALRLTQSVLLTFSLSLEKA